MKLEDFDKANELRSELLRIDAQLSVLYRFMETPVAECISGNLRAYLTHLGTATGAISMEIPISVVEQQLKMDRAAVVASLRGIGVEAKDWT